MFVSRRLIARLRRAAACSGGVAATEFALCLPFLLGAGLMELDLANRAIVQTQVSQLAAQIADNASRIGDTSTLQDRKIYENDINDLLRGAALQDLAEAFAGYAEFHGLRRDPPPDKVFLLRMMQQFPDANNAGEHHGG